MTINRRQFLKLGAGIVGSLAGDLIALDEVYPRQAGKEKIRKNLEPMLDEMTRKVIEIESGWRYWAQRTDSKDTGLMQIKPIVLKEWNEHSKWEKYNISDLFNPYKNVLVGMWYLHDRIGKHYIPSYGLDKIPENKLVCYKSGPTLIGRDLKIKNALEEFERLPKDAQDYLKKYERLSNGRH